MHFRSILSAAVAIAVCSSLQSVEASKASKRLTSSDFSASVADGATFIKFYSPECQFSQKLAPTWEQLVEEHKDWHTTRGFKFAEVDCVAQNDLCEANEVVSYPSIRLFYKGQQVAKYTKQRSIEVLREYVASMSAEYINVPSNADQSNVGEVKINALGKVVALDQESYERRTRFGPWLVEYYAPWCGHCKALAPIYDELAVVLKDKVNVGKVDCTQNEDICRQEQIRGYPTIKLHQHGQSVEYRKQRSLESMSEFALGATVPSLKPVNLGDLDDVKDGNDVAFIYVHKADTSLKVTEIMEMLSQIYYEQISIYSSVDPELASHLSVTGPALVVLKNNRQYQYQGSLSDASSIQSWIEQIRNPIVTTLTSYNTGTFLSQPGWIALGLVDPSKPATTVGRRELIEAAQKYHDTLEGRTLLDDKALRFAILDATKWEGYVHGAFNLQLSNLPAVVVVNSRQEMFYPFGLDGRRVAVEEEALLKYIEEIESGLLAPKSMVSLPQKVFREVGKRFQVVTRFSMQHPMVAMTVGVAFLLALLRAIGGKPEDAEEKKKKEEDEGKEKQE
ncbi:thioredoxin-like protein [Mortierella sp. GBAus27b]|nr:hypothetical protein BGX31_011121 [Mortierella sp. GBA43]KAI8353933.1 thioredoxin-like protein [Mortierella sp. GBAus27b]